MKSYLKNKKGFTLLEVLAALVILSAALIPVMSWVPISIQTKLKTERKTTAIFLAQSKTEELRYRIINDFNYTDNGGSFNPPDENFSYTATYNLVEDNLKMISVKVWHMEKPEDETIFYTQIAQR